MFALPSKNLMFWGVIIALVVIVAVFRFGLLKRQLTGMTA